MERLPFGYVDAIAHVFSTLPEPIADRLRHVHFFCGTDPVFAGLHPYRDVGDGRSYKNTAHCAYVHNQRGLPADRRVTTIVLPTRCAANYWTIYHELGHALHEIVGFAWLAPETTEHSKTNRYEAFAEAFCAWRWPHYCGFDLRMVGPQTNDLFERLASVTFV